MKPFFVCVIVSLSLFTAWGQQAESRPKASWRYVLLNDVSGRTLWPGGIEQQADAAETFLREAVRAESDIGSLVNFNDAYYLEVENSTDPNELAKHLGRRGRQGTAIYDALVAAARWLDKQESSDRRKIIFVFSDGDDDASYTRLDGAISAVRILNIPIIFVAPSAVEHKMQGRNIKQLAKGTGGYAYFVSKNGTTDFSSLKRDLGR